MMLLPRTSRGNVLFLILLGIAIFAALSYAVTASMRGGGQSISQEKALAVASEIIAYGTQVERAVERLQTVNDCQDEAISFENSVVTGYANANAPADYTCHVFKKAGGGLVFQAPPKDNGTANYYFSGNVAIRQIGTNDGTSNSNELVMALPVQTLTLCKAINNALRNPDTLAIDWVSGKFAGTYNYGNGMPDDGGAAKDFYGIRSACFQTESSSIGGVGGPYFYFNTLIAR